MKEFLKMQAKQNQMMEETMAKLTEQREDKNKKEIFSRWFKH